MPRRKASAHVRAAQPALPQIIRPQLATLAKTPPRQEFDWLYEVKLDGYRLLPRLDHGNVALFTRNQNDWTAKFPGIAEALARHRIGGTWLDGEAVVLDEHGRPNFHLLQTALANHDTRDVLFYAFDLLYANGHDLRTTPLIERKSILQGLVGGPKGNGRVRFCESFDPPAADLLIQVCKQGLEGIIGKRRDSFYRAGRSSDWLKLKCVQRGIFVIGGYTRPENFRDGFGALLLGATLPGGGLRYVGRVGTGFNSSSRRSIFAHLRLLHTDAPTLVGYSKRTQAKAVWVKPELKAAVDFRDVTKTGRLRHTSFKGLRP